MLNKQLLDVRREKKVEETANIHFHKGRTSVRTKPEFEPAVKQASATRSREEYRPYLLIRSTQFTSPPSVQISHSRASVARESTGKGTPCAGNRGAAHNSDNRNIKVDIITHTTPLQSQTAAGIVHPGVGGWISATRKRKRKHSHATKSLKARNPY